jgi:hypothetical protein
MLFCWKKKLLPRTPKLTPVCSKKLLPADWNGDVTVEYWPWAAAVKPNRIVTTNAGDLLIDRMARPQLNAWSAL